MNITDKEYQKLVKIASPASKKLQNCFNSFIIGGGICAFGQLLIFIYEKMNLKENEIKAAVPVTLIIIASVLTALRIFDNIAKHAGAGTLVPITGFANAVVSAAMEFKNEGFILGVGAKIFSVAGPVIAYGTAASAVYGIIYWIYKLMC